MAALLSILLDPRMIALLGVLLLLNLVSLAFYRIYFHPLAKFPGPKLAAISRYYEGYYDAWKQGRYIFEIEKMHRKYGPIVRISPNELHVHDLDFIDKIYSLEGRWDKYDFPIRAFPSSLATTHASFEHDLHRMRRAALNPFFSKQKVATLEPLIEKKIDQLSRRLQEFAASANVVSIGSAYSALTMDIITEYAMIKGQDNLQAKDFNREMAEAVRGAAALWQWGKLISWIPWLCEKTPVWVIKQINAPLAQWTAMQQNSFRETQELLSPKSSDSIQEKAHKTIFYELLHSESLPTEEKSLNRIYADMHSVVGAGTETVAYALRVITYHLCENPVMVQKLRTELQPVDLSSRNSRKISQLEQLPYLHAIINEGLRLSYGIVSRLARIAPDRFIEYGEWKIPPGTPVGMSSGLIHHDPNAFPQSHAFDPERWIDPAERRRLEKYLVPFSRGTRNCLGINLAWAELYLIVAIIFTRFDFSLHDTSIDDVAFAKDMWFAEHKSHNGVRVTVEIA